MPVQELLYLCRHVRKMNDWPPSGAKVKSEWSCTSAPCVCFHDIDRANFTFIIYRSAFAFWSGADSYGELLALKKFWGHPSHIPRDYNIKVSGLGTRALFRARMHIHFAGKHCVHISELECDVAPCFGKIVLPSVWSCVCSIR